MDVGRLRANSSLTLSVLRETFCWTLSEFPHEFVWAMRVLSFLEADLSRYPASVLEILLAELDNADRTQPMSSIPFGLRNERTAVKLAVKAVQKTLKSYETTFNVDMQLLQDQFYHRVQLSYVRYASVVIRSNEKRILLRAVDQLEEYLEHLTMAESQDIIL